MTIALTVDSLKAILGREVEEIHLTIAKSNAFGLDPETIANSVGLSKDEVTELMQTDDYKDVRLLVGSQMLTDRVERDAGWDGIENNALRKLAKRTEYENDTETLLKIAAVANRATRRTAPPKEAGPLDPSQAGARVPLTLTRRYTERLNGNGEVTLRTEEQRISVLNGSAINPKFEAVKGLLQGVSAQAGVNGIGPQDPSEPHLKEYTTPSGNQGPKTALEQVAMGDDSKPFSMEDLLRAAQRAKR